MSRPILKLKSPRPTRKPRLPIDRMSVLRAEEKKRLATVQAEMDALAAGWAR
jgi:hypothetical protein